MQFHLNFHRGNLYSILIQLSMIFLNACNKTLPCTIPRYPSHHAHYDTLSLLFPHTSALSFSKASNFERFQSLVLRGYKFYNNEGTEYNVSAKYSCGSFWARRKVVLRCVQAVTVLRCFSTMKMTKMVQQWHDPGRRSNSPIVLAQCSISSIMFAAKLLTI